MPRAIRRRQTPQRRRRTVTAPGTWTALAPSPPLPSRQLRHPEPWSGARGAGPRRIYNPRRVIQVGVNSLSTTMSIAQVTIREHAAHTSPAVVDDLSASGTLVLQEFLAPLLLSVVWTLLIFLPRSRHVQSA